MLNIKNLMFNIIDRNISLQYTDPDQIHKIHQKPIWIWIWCTRTHVHPTKH